MKIILGLLVALAAAQNRITELVLDLEQRYRFSWTSVLFKEGAGEMTRAFEIGKTLMMSSHRENVDGRVTVKSVTDYLNRHEVDGAKNGRSFFLILGDGPNLKEELEQLSHRMNMEETIWLVCLDDKTSLHEYFTGINIVYNMDMLVTQPLPDGNKKVTEVYRIAEDQPLKVSSYGVWTADHGLKSEVPVSFHARRQNLEGINVKVAVKQRSIRTGKTGRQHFGILGVVWMDLQSKLNFTSTFRMVKESELSLPGGIIGFMDREKMDVGLTEVTMSRASCSDVHCLRPIVATKTRLFFKKTRLNIRWDSVLKPFHRETWIAIFFWFMVSSVGLGAFSRMSRKYGLDERMVDRSVLDSALTVFSAVCQKGSGAIPDSLPCRVIFFLSYIVAAVLFTVYSASLASFVTVQEPHLPFEDLRQLLEDGTYSLQPIPYSDTYMFYANATDAFHQKVFRELIARESSLPRNKAEALERVCRDEKVVYIGTEFETRKAVKAVNRRGHCEIISPPKPLHTSYITILLSKSSHFKELFNAQLDSLILTGLVDRIARRVRLDMEEAEETTFAGVANTQLVQIYAILILGMISSIVILIAEKLAHAASAKKEDQKVYTHLHHRLPGVNWYNYYVIVSPHLWNQEGYLTVDATGRDIISSSDPGISEYREKNSKEA